MSRHLSARSRASADREASGCPDDYRRHAGVGMQSECQAQTLLSLAEKRGAPGPHGGMVQVGIYPVSFESKQSDD